MRGIVSCLMLGLVAIALGAPARAEYRAVESRSAQRILIFVHGLWGDPDATFSAGRGSPSWFEIIKNDSTSLRGQPSVSSYSIGLLAFPAGRGDRLSASQVAGILSRNMRDAGLLEGNKELFFVAHSLGGIVVKEMLLDSLTNPAAKSLFTQTKGVFLISVPTSGSEAADFIANKLPVFAGGRIIADLRSVGDNTFLQSLQRRWDNMMRLPLTERPSVYCAYETQATMGLMVVPQQYSERYCDEAAEAMNADHITIVKPTSVKSQVHDWLRGSLADLHTKRAVSHRPSAGDGQDLRPASERHRVQGKLQTDIAPPIDPALLPKEPPDRRPGHGVMNGVGDTGPGPLLKTQ